jgi:hypothetical protein
LFSIISNREKVKDKKGKKKLQAREESGEEKKHVD